MSSIFKRFNFRLLVSFLTICVITGGTSLAMSQTPNELSDEAAIREAIDNYVDAFYKADPSLAEKSVRHDLAKRGYPRDNDTGEYWAHAKHMSFYELLDLSGHLFKDDPPAADAPQDTTIFEILDKTASAKVVAVWGIDYFHLAKLNGRWMVVNVLWQAHPMAD